MNRTPGRTPASSVIAGSSVSTAQPVAVQSSSIRIATLPAAVPSPSARSDETVSNARALLDSGRADDNMPTPHSPPEVDSAPQADDEDDHVDMPTPQTPSEPDSASRAEDEDDMPEPQSAPAADSESRDDPNWVPSVRGSSCGSKASKRPYRFITRTPSSSPRRISERPNQWLERVNTITIPELRRLECCKSKKCFQNVDFCFFIERAKEIVTASAAIRRATLNGFKVSDGSFHFNGRPVCVRFLKKAFHFGTDMIADSRSTHLASSSSYDNIEIYEITSERRAAVIENSRVRSWRPSSHSTSNSAKPLSTDSQQKLKIISFLTRLSQDCSDKIPNKPELHLPFFRRSDVYSHFATEHNSLYPSQQVPTSSYFMRIWRTFCDYIKVRRRHGFTMCDRCDELRKALHHAVIHSIPTNKIMEEKAAHIAFVNCERTAYALKRDRARLDPSSFLSVIIDGADQSAFGLPHFVTSVKSVRGHSIKVKLIGVIHHSIPNKIQLFTMTEDHETGSNHIVETLHRFVNMQHSKGPLPRTLYIQLDNCSRENKNHFLMAYLESLVAMRVFDVVEAGFLPVGHTHEDIDQAFSVTSSRLRVNNAITLSDLHYQLSQTHNGMTKVNHMKRVINWSGLCSKESCIIKIPLITQFRYFKFSRASCTGPNSNAQSVPCETRCHVKRNSNEEWSPITSTEETNRGVLRFCPNFRNIPSTVVTCPEGKDEVMKRLASEEGRVNSATKMRELHELKDSVFADRVDKPHWNLQNIVEMKALLSKKPPVSNEEEVPNDDEFQPSNPGQTSINELESQVLESYDFDDDIEQENPTPPTTSALPTPQTSSTLPAQASAPQPTKRTRVSGPTPAVRRTQPSTQVTYTLGHFVILKLESETNQSTGNHELGVAKIVAVEKNDGEEFARRLKVHWYDVEESNTSGSPLSGKFFPCYNNTEKRRRVTSLSSQNRRAPTQVPWTDIVDTDAVVITFTGLKKNRMLPVNVQNKLTS